MISGIAIILNCLVHRIQRKKLHQFYNQEIIRSETRIVSANHTEAEVVPLTEHSVPDPDWCPLNEVTSWCRSNLEKTIPYTAFQISKRQLGSGNFGTVFEGILKTTRQRVAIKIAKKTWSLTDQLKQLRMLLLECKVMQHIPPHPNILNMVGACIEHVKDHGELFLVTELCECGSLLDFLRGKLLVHAKNESNGYIVPDNMTIAEADLLSFSAQIAEGMRHLNNIPLLHRDLSLKNILLTTQGIVKIADFGLTKHADIYEMISSPIPSKWTDIEVFQSKIFTKKSDTWSFGVTLYELWSLGAEPYEEWGKNFH